jgi:choice-of-anchor B domain-containing protein
MIASMKPLIFILLLLPGVAKAQTSLNMTFLSNLDLPNLPTRFGSEYNDCWGFTHSNGTEVAIIGGIESIFFVNITSPANPVLIYTHPVTNMPAGTTNQSLWRDFKSYQNYVYAAADEGTSGLLIFDLSQVPTAITMVTQTVSFWNRTHNIYIDEAHGKLYAAGSNSVSNGLVILNIAVSPTNPTLAANVPLNTVGGGYVHDVHVRDNIAYCSHGSQSKLQMYDFSNLPTFTVVGTVENYPFPGYNHSSWLNGSGNLLAMCDETHGSHVKLVDITDPQNISSDDFSTFYSEMLGAGAPGASVAHNPFILGDLVFLAYYHDGVQVFDISNPENIQLLAYYDTYPQNTGYTGFDGCWGVYPFFPSGVLIASDQNNGLFVLQITSGALDIEFLSFQAFRKNEDVRLEWTVMDASFGHIFEVKRSADGGQSFQTIGKVNLSDNESNYAFTDQSVSGSTRYVYRIDFVQLDGSKIASPVRYVRTESRNAFFRLVNPVTSSLVLDVMQPVESLNLQLFTIEGRSIWGQQMDESRARMEFDIAGLPPGQYVLTLQWTGGSENLILQKAQ